jgi:hypothetical protein
LIWLALVKQIVRVNLHLDRDRAVYYAH